MSIHLPSVLNPPTLFPSSLPLLSPPLAEVEVPLLLPHPRCASPSGAGVSAREMGLGTLPQTYFWSRSWNHHPWTVPPKIVRNDPPVSPFPPPTLPSYLRVWNMKLVVTRRKILRDWTLVDYFTASSDIVSIQAGIQKIVLTND